jgi:hypothetical protein
MAMSTLVIRIDPVLPCGVRKPLGLLQFCMLPAHHAIMTEGTSGIWWTLPVCSRHLAEIAPSFGESDRVVKTA